MQDPKPLLDCLENTPFVLKTLLDQIPQHRYKIGRVPGKWSIHEQVCHLVDAQNVLWDRFQKFADEENPLIVSYDPLAGKQDGHYLNLDMEEELENFSSKRKELLKMLRRFAPSYWNLAGRHEGFSPYSTRALLVHALNVDYAHLFSIEQLGLTKEGMEVGILSIP